MKNAHAVVKARLSIPDEAVVESGGKRRPSAHYRTLACYDCYNRQILLVL